jgi:hypothetical protein
VSPVLVTIAAIGALGVASFAWIYGAHLAAGDPIRSDGVGYYIYLPAILLDHDVTMQTTVGRSFAAQGDFAPGLVRTYPEHRFLDEFGIGEAVMILPFFVVGHLVAIASGASRNGFSWPYQAAAAAAGFTYALAGLLLLASILRRWFSPRTVVVTLVAIAFGTDLFHYATFDAVFSHAFSFFLVALVVRLALAALERPGPKLALALGALLGLVTLVRPTNLVVLLFCALLGVESRRALRARVDSLRRHRRLLALGTGVFVLTLVPQALYWHAVRGRFFVYADPGHLNLLHPHLVGVLFSVRKGLFFWTPLLLLAVAGFARLRRFAPGLLVPAIAFLIVHTWVVASWNMWWYGGSFGMRPFVEALPVLALGLAALVEAASAVPARHAVNGAIALTTLVAVHGMLAYWTRHIPYDGTTWHEYVSSYAHI